MAKSVNMLQAYISQKRDINANPTLSAAEKSAAIKEIEVDGAKIDDLCLDFTLPGDETYELKVRGYLMQCAFFRLLIVVVISIDGWF